MKSKFLIGAVAVIALGVFAVALLQQPSVSYTAPASVADNAPVQTQPAQTQPQPTTQPQQSGYAMADVAKHDNASSCWTAINGKVYDVTKWINQHPGGPQRILSLCGTDGSSAFNNQHGGQARPEQELSSFYIGNLAG